MNNCPEIDFVITWVDGGDHHWREEKKEYNPDKSTDDREERYRDWELLKYWFRGVEKYAPWVRKIHFVTWGHLPLWLDTSNPKLNIVNHRDFIPEEYLPTFNSNVIEMHFHRIKGLSENFVYFNDDFFPIKELKPEDFFIDGKPCDMLAFQPVIANPKNPVMSYIYLNNTVILSKYFDKRENVRKQPGKYFKPGYPLMNLVYNMLELAFPQMTGFYTVHGPFPLKKSTYEVLWDKEKETLENASKEKFRSKNDISPYVFREWQKLSGEFVAKNVQKQLGYFNLSDDNVKLIETIKKQKRKVVCINDANEKIDFKKVKQDLMKAFDEVLPEKSAFEI